MLHLHAVASLEPAGAAAFAPHAMQAAASAAASCVLTVPAGHAVQLLWSNRALKVPTGHARQVRDKASSVKNPGRHRQSNCVDPPTSSRELFPTHGTGAIACSGQYVSTGHAAHASLLM